MPDIDINKILKDAEQGIIHLAETTFTTYKTQAIADGKALYATHCKSCHGTKGLGDGSKAAQLKTEPGDFSKANHKLAV